MSRATFHRGKEGGAFSMVNCKLERNPKWGANVQRVKIYPSAAETKR